MAWRRTVKKQFLSGRPFCRDSHAAPPLRDRQIAMYLSKQLTPRSLPEIGRRFGGRDHTTIMHGVRKIEELMSTDSQLSDDLQLLRRLLQG